MHGIREGEIGGDRIGEKSLRHGPADQGKINMHRPPFSAADPHPSHWNGQPMAHRTKRMIDEDQGMQDRGPRWGRQSHPQDSLLCSIKNPLVADRYSFYPGSCISLGDISCGAR
jgi:hypothetical protein